MRKVNTQTVNGTGVFMCIYTVVKVVGTTPKRWLALLRGHDTPGGIHTLREVTRIDSPTECHERPFSKVLMGPTEVTLKNLAAVSRNHVHHPESPGMSPV